MKDITTTYFVLLKKDIRMINAKITKKSSFFLKEFVKDVIQSRKSSKFLIFINTADLQRIA